MYPATCRDSHVQEPPRWGRVGDVTQVEPTPSGHRTRGVVEHAHSAYDMWSALLAGEAAWSGEHDLPSARERVAASVQLLALTALSAPLWLAVSGRVDTAARPSLLWGAASVVTLAAVLFAVRPLGIVLGRPPRPSPVVWRMTWRTLMAITLIAGVVTVLPGWLALGLWPLGVAAGADAVLGAWALGMRLRPLQWWLQSLTSPAHLGVLGAVVALLITRGDSSMVAAALALYVALHVALVAALITISLLLHLERSIEREVAYEGAHGMAAEHRRLAHWIHDDVCADLQLTALRLTTGHVTAEGVAHELSELDHRLRLRQQQEIIESGQARLAELLQPYVRRAQSAGVRITEVPTLNDASLRVDRPTAELFARSVSTLTSNALSAGATELGIRVMHGEGLIRLSVVDDAGGFDLDAVPAGRGLDALVQDLGRDHLEVQPYGAGSRVTVTIPTCCLEER